MLVAPSTAQVGAVHEDACRVKVVMCSRNSGLRGLVEAEQGIALTPSASQQRLGWSRKKNPPLGQPAGSAQSLAEGEDGGQHRGHSELPCSGCAPPPPQVGLREEGATCKPSLRGCNPWVPPCRVSAVTPPQSRCPTTEAPSQQIQRESVKDAMQSSAVPRAQPRGDAVALNATAAIPCSPFASI